MGSRSPDTDSCGSPIEEPRSYVVLGNEPNRNDEGTAVSHMEANAPKTPTANTPKSKARATFTDSQMNILSERFSMQRYLSPSEMRGLAEVTGLTYKQVRRLLDSRKRKCQIHNIAYTEMCVLFFLFFLKGEDLVSEPQDEAKEGTEEHRHRLGTRTLRRQQRPPSQRCTPQLFAARPACSFPRLRAFVFRGYSKLCGLVLPTLPVKLWQERQRLGHRTKSSLNGGRFVVLFWP